MEQGKALRQLEGRLSVVGDRSNVLHGKLEDLLFRAQRIAAQARDDGGTQKKVKVADTMFGADLQIFRRDIRAFSQDASGLASAMGSIEHSAVYDEGSVMACQAVMRLADRLHKGVAALVDQTLLAHQHIREAEFKIEAWYLMQEVEAIAQMTQVLPGIANKALVKISTPTPGGHHHHPSPAPAAPAPAPGGPLPAAGATLQRKAPAPLRPVGRVVGTPNPVPPSGTAQP